MYSTTGDDLDNRDYYFSSTEPTPIGKFDDGGYLINFDYKSETIGLRAEIENGIVSFQKW